MASVNWFIEFDPQGEDSIVAYFEVQFGRGRDNVVRTFRARTPQMVEEKYDKALELARSLSEAGKEMRTAIDEVVPDDN